MVATDIDAGSSFSKNLMFDVFFIAQGNWDPRVLSKRGGQLQV